MFPATSIFALALLLPFSALTTVATADTAPRLIRRIPLASAAGETDVFPSIAVASAYSSIVRVKSSSASAVRRRAESYHSSPLHPPPYGTGWAIPVTFGGEELLLELDMRNADTSAIHDSFRCLDLKGGAVPQLWCGLGPLYSGTFLDGEIKDQNFNFTYVNDDDIFHTEMLNGVMGYIDITVAGLEVKKQEFGLVTTGLTDGHRYTSGRIGLAYSALTNAFIGNEPKLDNDNVTGTAMGDQTPYSPILQTMIAQGLSPPLFSLALMRPGNYSDDRRSGYLALGGVPPVAFDPVFTSTPIEIYEFNGRPESEASVRSFYTIKPEAYVYAGENGTVSSHATSTNAIVDSSELLLRVPSEVAASYFSAFSPPPVRGPDSGDDEKWRYVPCDSPVPYFGVKIGGTVFNISSTDLVIPDSGYTDDETGVEYCGVGIRDGGSGGPGVDAYPIFGDVFLNNVVAVFDVGAGMMRFAAHDY